MKEEIEILVNWLYKEWCMTNDPFEEDFENLLENKLPNLKFSFNIGTSQWILI